MGKIAALWIVSFLLLVVDYNNAEIKSESEGSKDDSVVVEGEFVT
jgi:hypothetical protein